MNKSTFAGWTQTVSSLAIIATLIFLAVETQQNTHAIEASTREAALNGTRQFLVQAWQDPETIIAWTKSEPTDAEVLVQFYSLTHLVSSHEGTWVQYQRGVLDRETWERQMSALPEVLQFERNRMWWQNYGANAFDPAFVAEVNQLITDTPVRSSSVADNVRPFFEEGECRSNVAC